MTPRSDGLSSRGTDIIDHSDPKSGIRVRVKKRSSKSTRRSDRYKVDGEETGDDYQGEETANNNHYNDYDNDGEMVSKRTFYEETRGTSSSLSDSESGYGKSTRGLSSRHRKPKRCYSIYYKERNAKSDSELQLSYNRYIFHRQARRRRSSKVVSRREQKSGNQSHAEDNSGVSGEEWEPIIISSSLKTKKTKRSASMGDIVSDMV